MSLETLLATTGGEVDSYGRDLIERAYYFARNAHKGQKRKSGEDYFVHCEAVAQILADLNLDTPVIAAGLLHHD